MQVSKDSIVTFHYVLKGENGEELERSDDEPVAYLHGHRNIMPALEDTLVGAGVGEARAVTLPPERAYGLRKDDAIQRVSVKHVLTKAKRFHPGMVVQVNTANGPRDVIITKVGKFNLDVDTNHPLAGKTVTFEMTIDSIRPATSEELAHGHSHGDGGHHH